MVDVAAKIWTAIAEIKSVSEIKWNIFSEYQVSESLLDSEIQRFISQLIEESLIIPVGGLSLVEPISERAPGVKKFDSPILETFTDLQEFLLLDPIHEISNIGLPKGKSLE